MILEARIGDRMPKQELFGQLASRRQPFPYMVGLPVTRDEAAMATFIATWPHYGLPNNPSEITLSSDKGVWYA